MTVSALTESAESFDWLTNTINYEIINGNAIWRFVLVLLVILAAMVAGRISQFAISAYASRKEGKQGITALTLLLKCLSKPTSVVVFAFGFYLCRLCLVFEDKTATPIIKGIKASI
jgi:hypothetical protein